MSNAIEKNVNSDTLFVFPLRKLQRKTVVSVLLSLLHLMQQTYTHYSGTMSVCVCVFKEWETYEGKDCIMGKENAIICIWL